MEITKKSKVRKFTFEKQKDEEQEKEVAEKIIKKQLKLEKQLSSSKLRQKKQKCCYLDIIPDQGINIHLTLQLIKQKEGLSPQLSFYKNSLKK